MTADPRSVTKRGYCTLCRSRCGAIYTVRDDRLLGVQPDAEHPTGSALCAKGRAAPELVHSPRRLTRPLRRTNPKSDPDPGWVEIGWDEALDEIADRLGEIRARDGAESVAFAVTSPSGTPMSDGIDWVERLVRLFGSPNIVYATEICNWHKDYAHAFTFGSAIGVPDYENADLVLLWGHNPARSWLAQSTAIGRAQTRGARVAVVDPRKAGSAQTADLWLRVRPGSDAALALGVARQLIVSGRYDEEFVRRWTNGPLLVRADTGRFLRGGDVGLADADAYVGWDGDRPTAYDDADPWRLDLRNAVDVETAAGTVRCTPAFRLYADTCASWTPEGVAATTWVPEADVAALADAIADADSVAYYSWSGVGQHTNATSTERAIACLYALTGSHDRPGGNVMRPAVGVNAVTSFDQLRPEQRAKALGLAERPLGPPSQGWVTARDTYSAILDHEPYPVRALVGFGANMLVSQAGNDRGRAALRALDFHVHCNPFMNPTAELADVVLPVNSPWEREGLRVGFEISHAAQELVQLRQAMVPPQGQSRSDTEIAFALASRLGLATEFFDGSIEAAWEHVLEPLPFGVAELRERPEGIRVPLERRFRKYAEPDDSGAAAGFATQTGRVELYSELLLRHGYDPLPGHVEPAASPLADDADASLPYVLTTAKNSKFCHSQHRGLASLRARVPEPVVDLSPELADGKHILEGDWVRLRTAHGSIRMRAHLDESLHPGVVVSEFGWWEAAPDLGLPGYDPFSERGSNYNRLVDAHAGDPVSGSVPLRSLLCDVVPEPEPGRWQGTRPLRVREVRPETPDTVSLLLEVAEGSPLPAYAPGQHVDVTVDRRGTGRDTGTRSYSLSGTADGPDDHVRVTVKREGAVSRLLADEVRPGDTVRVGAPKGRFRLPVEPDQPVVLIAGGVGITPFMSYLERLRATRPDAEIHLFCSFRDGAHHLFGPRLRRLAGELPGLLLRTHFTRPGRDDRIGVDFDARGRVTADTIPRALVERRARFYLCGPDAMLTGLRDGLVAGGVPAFDVFTERFTSPTPTWTPDPNARHDVAFARSDRVIEWQASAGSLLSLAEKHSVAVPSGCRTGECESCAVRILSGAVRYLVPDADPDDDARCITCQAVPVTDLVLDA